MVNPVFSVNSKMTYPYVKSNKGHVGINGTTVMASKAALVVYNQVQHDEKSNVDMRFKKLR